MRQAVHARRYGRSRAMKKSSKRSVDLPKNCKDLHDLLVRGNELRRRVVELRHGPIPPISRRVQIPSRVTVQQLAAIAGRDPALIVADLLGFGTLALSLERQVEFEPAAMILLTYGIEAEKVG